MGGGGATKRDVVELRIHGVGGSPGERLLGLDHPDDAVLVAEGVGTAFIARREEREVQGYDWGSLTSGSALQPLWVLLLPFTLINVAGWMHPPVERAGKGRVRFASLVVHLLAACMTASWVLYLSVIFIELFGFRLVREMVASGKWRWSWWELEWLLAPVGPAAGVGYRIHWLTLVGGACAVGLIVFLLFRISGNTQRAFEGKVLKADLLSQPISTSSADKGWPRIDLASIAFFGQGDRVARRSNMHAVVAATTLIVAVAFVACRLLFGTAGWMSWLGYLLLPIAALEFLLVGVLAALTFDPYRRPGELRLPMGPAAVAVLAFALTNATFSGLILMLVKRARDWSGADVEQLPPGPELVLTDVWLLLVLALVIIVLVWFLTHRARGDASDVDERQNSPGTELDGVDPTWRQRIAHSRGLASGARAAPYLVMWIAVMFYVVGLGAAAIRVSPLGWPWNWEVRSQLAWDPAWEAGAWLLPLLPLFLMATVRRAATSQTARRTVGILWDVLTFWPRRFHPLGVRPYSERAVVELQGRLLDYLRRGCRVVVSAHSQGSVLAFAAVSALRGWCTDIALVTYGSPIRTLYGYVFPAYFGNEAVESLRRRLLGGDPHGWRNFYRDTDPIGGPVFEPDLATGHLADADVSIRDPAIEPKADEIPEQPREFEEDRLSWSHLAGHSHYLRERDVKRWVRHLKAIMSVERCS